MISKCTLFGGRRYSCARRGYVKDTLSPQTRDRGCTPFRGRVATSVYVPSYSTITHVFLSASGRRHERRQRLVGSGAFPRF
jgi:hypothetical protein